MASLSKTSDGLRWRIRFYSSKRTPPYKDVYQFTKKGDSANGYTRIQIDEYQKDLENDFKANAWNPWDQDKKESPTIITVTSAIDGYLKKVKPTIKPPTYKTKVSTLKQFKEEFGEQRPITSIETEDIEDWVNEANKYTSRKKRKSEIILVFNYLKKKYRNESGIHTPEIEVAATKQEKNELRFKDFKTFLLREQLDFMLERLKRGMFRSRVKKDRELLSKYYLLGFLTGRRRRDLLSIKGEWISNSEPVLRLFDQDYISKGQRPEWVELNTEAWEILKDLKQPGPIFGDFSESFVSEEFEHLVQHTLPSELANKLSLHKLRDSAIMHMMYREGLSIPFIMARVGHAGFSSLQKYVHPNGVQLIRFKQEEWAEFLQNNDVELTYDSTTLKLLKAN